MSLSIEFRVDKSATVFTANIPTKMVACLAEIGLLSPMETASTASQLLPLLERALDEMRVSSVPAGSEMLRATLRSILRASIYACEDNPSASVHITTDE